MLLETSALPPGPIDGVINYGPAPGVVRDGEWRHNVDGYEGIAAYLGMELPGKVRRVSANVRWTGLATGTVALVLPLTDWSTTDRRWQAGVHLTVSRYKWKLSAYDRNETKPVYAEGRFWIPLRRSRTHRIGIEVGGRTVRVLLPRRRSATASHALIEDTTSEHVVFELFTRKFQTSAAMTQMFAEDYRPRKFT